MLTLNTLMRGMSVALLGLCAPQAADARDRQLGNIVYQPPAEWIVGRLLNEGWVTLLNDREDERCEFCTIGIHLGAPRKGSFHKWLRRRMELVLDDGRTIKDMPSKTFTQRGLGKVHMHSRLVMRKGERMQVFLGFKLEDRWELVHFEGRAGDEHELKEAQATLNEEFLPMLNRLGFVSEGKRPILGKPVPGTLDGVWFGSRIDYGLNLDATMRMDVNPVILTFWPNGRFFDGVPASGISGFDYDETVLKNTPDTGNYILKDAELRLFYADGDRSTLPRDGEAFEDGNASLTKVRLPENGFRFAGRLDNFDYHPFAAGISGGVAVSKNWVFLKDGTYVSDGFVSASGSFDQGGGFAISNSKAEDRGRYEVRDGLIRLTPPKGEGDVQRWPFFLVQYKGKWRPVLRGEYLSDED